MRVLANLFAASALLLLACTKPAERQAPVGSAAGTHGGTPAGHGASAGSDPSPPGSSGQGAGGAGADGNPNTAAGAGAAGSAPGGGAGSGGESTDGAVGPIEPADGGAQEPVRPKLAVTADFLHQTLSIVDLDKLVEGAGREDALVGTVDLSDYAPGPLTLAITPDGKTALVSVSASFLGAFITVPPGNGTLLFVDLETRTVVDELYTGDSPMGIVITNDGTHAFVGQYSENYFAYVDIAARTYVAVPTGNGFNEELAIDDSGEVGILTYGPSGNAVTFEVADPMGGLGATFGLTGDAAGVAFFPGTKRAFMLQAPTVLTGNVGGHNVIDVSDPQSPVAGDNVRMGSSPTWYPVTAVHARNSVAYPSAKDGQLSMVERKLEGDVATEVQTVAIGAGEFAYGVTAAPDGRVLCASPGEHYIAVVDLAAGTAYTVPWGITESGPTDIRLVP